jgi:hypothetical protein
VTSSISRLSLNSPELAVRDKRYEGLKRLNEAPKDIPTRQLGYLSEEVNLWLDTLVTDAPKLTRRQLTRAYADRLDAELKAGHWPWCNELCLALITQIEPFVRDYGNLVMTTLIYTLGAKDRIPARASLWDAVSSLMKQNGSFEEVKDILTGLK